MRAIVRTVAVVCALALPAVVHGQFGHPLKGQWSGEWGPSDKPNRLLLNFEWDGKAITGVINPGPNSAVVKDVVFDYSNPSAWGVKITAEGKDATGKDHVRGPLGERQPTNDRAGYGDELVCEPVDDGARDGITITGGGKHGW